MSILPYNSNFLSLSTHFLYWTTIMDKSPRTLLRFWAVSNPRRSNPFPSHHKQCWTRVSRIFSEFQLCIKWRRGGGELQENFCFKGEQRNDRKIWILQHCPKDFCPGLSESWFWEKSLFSSFFLRFLGILETSSAITMTFETIFST